MIKHSIILLLITCAGISVFGARQQAVRYKNAHGRRYVYLRDVATYYGMKCYVWKGKTSLYGRFKKLEFKHDSRFAVLNGVRTSMYHAPFRIGIHAFISEQDLFSILDPMLRKAALPSRRSKVILIDPGHGGKDQGGRGKSLLEKKLVMTVATDLRDRLKRLGFSVLMTRSGDYKVSLSRRAELCKKYKADLYISIHSNIAGNKKVEGIETFCLTPAKVGSTNGGKPATKNEIGNKYDKHNFALAYQVQRSLLRRTKADDRGVKFARFYVLKHAVCPAILVEIGFLSNAKEEKALATKWRQRQTAQAIVDGIIAYRKMMK
jgi:N-acetylmuramoyl-L-alanine amidase